MAILHCSSFDHQVAPTTVGGGGSTAALTNRKLADVIFSPALDTSTFLDGSASFKNASAAPGAVNFQHTISSATVTIGFWWYRAAGTISQQASLCRAAGASNNVEARLATTGIVYISGGAFDGSEVAVFTPAAATWYWISLAVNMSANPHVSTMTAYNTLGAAVGLASRNVAVASDTVASVRFGEANVGVGADLFTDSYVIADTGTVMAPQRVTLLRPTGNGAHSFTNNDFQDGASANLTTASDIATLVNKVPPSTATFVKQVVIRAAGYCEFTFADLPATGLGDASFVQLVAASHPVAGAGANTSMFRLVDGGTVTAEAIADMTATADTLEYHKHGYSTAPSTSGAWTTTLANALKARWGYADDVTPPPALDAIYLEVVNPITYASSSGKKARSRMAMAMGGMGV